MQAVLQTVQQGSKHQVIICESTCHFVCLNKMVSSFRLRCRTASKKDYSACNHHISEVLGRKGKKKEKETM